MSAAPPAKTIGTDLSDAEQRLLEHYAQAHGLSIEEAATRAVSQQLHARFVKPKRTGVLVRILK